jgi:hypothetical protein
MRIVGVLQVRNEINSGHLERFLKVNVPILDDLYVFDDASSDGTTELLIVNGAKLIKSPIQTFGQELKSKNKLLDFISESEKPGTWLFRLDADEACFASRREIEDLCRKAESLGCDSIVLRHLNLWKSETHKRVDDQFDQFQPVRLWKSSSKVRFPDRSGLHVTSDPSGLYKTMFSRDYPIFHYGFATEEHILNKALAYWKMGQRGYPLFRLLLDDTRELVPIDDTDGALGGRYARKTIDEAGCGSSSVEVVTKFNKQMVKEIPNVRITIVCLIFASTKWLEMQYRELLKIASELPKGEVEILFVANDPTEEVRRFLQENNVPRLFFAGKKHPDEWYINSVYRAYNEGVRQARGQQVLLVNSDMIYCDDFLLNMIRQAANSTFLAARLIERGRLASGQHAIEKELGSNPENFRMAQFKKIVERISEDALLDGGLYMPLLCEKSQFLKIGGFPEGNLRPESLEAYLEGEKPEFALKGDACIPGDAAFFEKARKLGCTHKTVLNAIAYHFQEGELVDSRKNRARDSVPTGIWVVNDTVRGINSEPVFWSRLVDRLKKAGIGVEVIEIGRAENRLSDFLVPFRLWCTAAKKLFSGPRPRLVFQNATYQFPIPFGLRLISLLQDQPRSSRLRLMQKMVKAKSDLIATNDFREFQKSKGRKSVWSPLPLDSFWYSRVADCSRGWDSKRRPLTVGFIGAFNETKGWPGLRSLVLKSTEISWELVSKFDGDNPFPESTVPNNVKIHRNLSQTDMRKLFSQLDVVVCSSPYETQHLVSLEALSQGIPVLTLPTGFLGNHGVGQKPWGVVANELTLDLLEQASQSRFLPAEVLNALGLGENDIWELWEHIILDELENTFRVAKTHQNGLIYFLRRALSAIKDILRRWKRRIIFYLVDLRDGLRKRH